MYNYASNRDRSGISVPRIIYLLFESDAFYISGECRFYSLEFHVTKTVRKQIFRASGENESGKINVLLG